MIEDCRDWTAIVAVANALLREKTLDGFEVEALVRDSKESFNATHRPAHQPRYAPLHEIPWVRTVQISRLAGTKPRTGWL